MKTNTPPATAAASEAVEAAAEDLAKTQRHGFRTAVRSTVAGGASSDK